MLRIFHSEQTRGPKRLGRGWVVAVEVLHLQAFAAV